MNTAIYNATSFSSFEAVHVPCALLLNVSHLFKICKYMIVMITQPHIYFHYSGSDTQSSYD